MTKTHWKSPSEPSERPDPHEGDESAYPLCGAITLPAEIAGSGTLDRLVETARDYATAAASENTLKAYANDWAHFARWCRMRGAEPMLPSPALIGLYISDLATPTGKAPAPRAPVDAETPAARRERLCPRRLPAQDGPGPCQPPRN